MVKYMVTFTTKKMGANRASGPSHRPSILQKHEQANLLYILLLDIAPKQ